MVVQMNFKWFQKSIVIHKNNKYGEFEANPVFYSKKKNQKCTVPNYPENFVIPRKFRNPRNNKTNNIYINFGSEKI
jgi:hypothetical protein